MSTICIFQIPEQLSDKQNKNDMEQDTRMGLECEEGPAMKDENITPYDLPDQKNHSFFFVDMPIQPHVEAPLHRHDAWELLCVVHGFGKRTAGDTVQDFAAGDIVLIPPNMIHRWDFSPDSADESGHIHYLMVAFKHTFVERCVATFPEVRNRLANITFPDNALCFSGRSALVLQKRLESMRPLNELERLSAMLLLLCELFTASDHTLAGRPMRIERNVQRMQTVCTFVMRNFRRTITLEEAAAVAGMNRSTFCSWFRKYRQMTFMQYLTQYRLETACELLLNSDKQVSEICFAVGFNDLPHFVRIFARAYGMPPARYRKRARSSASDEPQKAGSTQ